MDLVKHHGRYDDYNFSMDDSLNQILNSKLGTEICNDQKNHTLFWQFHDHLVVDSSWKIQRVDKFQWQF